MGLLAICYPKLNPADRVWIQAIRRRYDSNFNLVGPHISLVFEISNIGSDEFIAHIRSACRNFAKIEFNLRCATVMPGIANENYYLFLVPDQGNSEIVRLHDRLYTGLFAKHLRLDIPFVPHITVGILQNAQSCKEIADAVNQEHFNIVGTIETVDIISASLDSPGQERLETIEQIPLGKGK